MSTPLQENRSKSQKKGTGKNDELLKEFSLNVRRVIGNRENVIQGQRGVTFNPEVMEESIGGTQTPGRIKGCESSFDSSVTSLESDTNAATVVPKNVVHQRISDLTNRLGSASNNPINPKKSETSTPAKSHRLNSGKESVTNTEKINNTNLKPDTSNRNGVNHLDTPKGTVKTSTVMKNWGNKQVEVKSKTPSGDRVRSMGGVKNGGNKQESAGTPVQERARSTGGVRNGGSKLETAGTPIQERSRSTSGVRIGGNKLSDVGTPSRDGVTPVFNIPAPHRPPHVIRTPTMPPRLNKY